MRPSRVLAAFACLVALAGSARAETISFNTDYQPDLVNLFSTVPFTAPSSLPTGWQFVFDPASPNFIQLWRPAGFGILNPTPPQGAWLTYDQSFAGTVSTNPAFKMDWQEVYYNFATNSFVQGFAGRLESNGAGFVNGTYAATPGLGPTTAGGAPLFIGPAPEPSSLVAFGVGLGVLGYVRRRRRVLSAT
jgi:hypothetical protein